MDVEDAVPRGLVVLRDPDFALQQILVLITLGLDRVPPRFPRATLHIAVVSARSIQIRHL